MDTFSAYNRSLLASGNRYRVFDWNAAAGFIQKNKPKSAVAGLKNDMEYTSGCIYQDGEIISEYTYLCSNWATPILVLYFEDGSSKQFDCWIYKDESNWNADTKWPDSAIQILENSK